MATSIFDNKEIVPNEDDLKNVLKDKIEVWNQLISYLEEEYGSLTGEWKFYSKNAGWTYRVTGKKRNLVFLSPNDEYFLVTINMSVKVSKILLDMDFKEEIKKIIKETKAYREGLSVLIEIKSENDLEDIKTMLNVRDD
jgi:hypothetical protein